MALLTEALASMPPPPPAEVKQKAALNKTLYIGNVVGLGRLSFEERTATGAEMPLVSQQVGVSMSPKGGSKVSPRQGVAGAVPKTVREGESLSPPSADATHTTSPVSLAPESCGNALRKREEDIGSSFSCDSFLNQYTDVDTKVVDDKDSLQDPNFSCSAPEF